MLFTDLLDEYLDTKAEAERAYDRIRKTDDGDGPYSPDDIWKMSSEYQEHITAKNAINQMVGGILMSKEFHFEGDHLRIRGLEEDSAVGPTAKPGMRTWVLEHNLGERWVRDMCIYLPNEASIEDAFRKLRFPIPPEIP